MLRQKKGLILGLVGSFVLGAVSLAGAQDTYREIVAGINDNIKIKVNGNDFTARDTDGTTLKPIIYNGRSYLPVKSSRSIKSTCRLG